MRNNKIEIGRTVSEWVQLATKSIISQATQAITNRGFYTLVLSGGSTPEIIYQELTLPYIQEILEWKNCFIFWGDERCVPPDHQESNYRMAKIAMLDHIPIPEKNVFRIKGELNPEVAAKEYQQIINDFFYGKEKRFDTILLGLGGDGHTASLFPGTKGLSERNQWVISNPHPYSNSSRITLTYPAINNSRNIIFLVRGSNKSDIVADVIQNPNQPPLYPAKGIVGKENPPEWIIDITAAKTLINSDH